GALVKLTATVHGAFSGVDDTFRVFIDNGTCGDGGVELACNANNNFGGGPVIASAHPLAVGDVVTIFVEDPQAGRFNLNIAETAIVTLADGAACDPASDTAVCGAPDSCLG